MLYILMVKTLVVLNITNKLNVIDDINLDIPIIHITNKDDYKEEYLKLKNKYIIYPIWDIDYSFLYKKFKDLRNSKGFHPNFFPKYYKYKDLEKLDENKLFVLKTIKRYSEIGKIKSIKILKNKDITKKMLKKYDIIQEYTDGDYYSVDIIYDKNTICYIWLIKKTVLNKTFTYPNLIHHFSYYNSENISKDSDIYKLCESYIKKLKLKNIGVLNIDIIEDKIIETNFRNSGYFIRNKEYCKELLNNYIQVHNSINYKTNFKNLNIKNKRIYSNLIKNIINFIIISIIVYFIIQKN